MMISDIIAANNETLERDAGHPIGTPSIRVIGFDPGWANFGFAIARVLPAPDGIQVVPLRLGTWKTAPTAKKRRVRQANDDRRRGRMLASCMLATIAEHRPALICAESKVGSRNSRQATALGRANGVIDAVAEAAKLSVLEVSPTELKKAVTGRGNAGKESVEFALRGRLMDGRRIVGGEPSDHAWDALGAIVACTETEEFRLLLAAAGSSGPHNWQEVKPAKLAGLRP